MIIRASKTFCCTEDRDNKMSLEAEIEMLFFPQVYQTKAILC